MTEKTKLQVRARADGNGVEYRYCDLRQGDVWNHVSRLELETARLTGPDFVNQYATYLRMYRAFEVIVSV